MDAPPSSSRRSVLIVEDDGAIRRAISDLLSDEGYSVVAVGDVRAARLVLARHEVSAVVLDWCLENDTAEPILRGLAASGAPVAVVLVSATPEGAGIARKFSVPFVRKPLNVAELGGVVEGAIARGVRVRAPD